MRSGLVFVVALAIAFVTLPSFAQEKVDSTKGGSRAAPNKDRTIAEPQRSPQSRAYSCVVSPTATCELSGQWIIGEMCACESEGKRMPGKAK